MKLSTALFTQEIPENGAVRGHIRFTSPSKDAGDLALVGVCANVMASLLFERMQAHGTNLIVQLSDRGMQVDVLARTENDGLDFRWTPKPADPGRMEELQARIKNKTFFIGKEPAKASAPVKERLHEEEAVPAPSQEVSHDDEDYLVKQLHRIP